MASDRVWLLLWSVSVAHSSPQLEQSAEQHLGDGGPEVSVPLEPPELLLVEDGVWSDDVLSAADSDELAALDVDPRV